MLVCLVGAMTGTSALLGWIDPSPAIRAEAPPLETVLRQARSLVTADVVIREAQWRKIEILAGPASAGSAAYLTATAYHSTYHFHVDLEGRPTRASGWSYQHSFDEQPRAVRVQVACWKPHQPMSRAQWQSVRALIAELREAIATQGMDLPVCLEQEWAEVYGLEAGTSLQITPLEHF